MRNAKTCKPPSRCTIAPARHYNGDVEPYRWHCLSHCSQRAVAPCVSLRAGTSGARQAAPGGRRRRQGTRPAATSTCYRGVLRPSPAAREVSERRLCCTQWWWCLCSAVYFKPDSTGLCSPQSGGLFGNMGALMEQARVALRWRGVAAESLGVWSRGPVVCDSRRNLPQVKKAQQVVQVEAVKVQKELAACVPGRSHHPCASSLTPLLAASQRRV